MVDNTEQQSPQEILLKSRAKYEALKEDRFQVGRGLLSKEDKEYGYIDLLPTFQGKNFIQLVNNEIQKRKQELAKTGSPYKKVTIVDIGYGKGFFLLDCRKIWGDDVELIGYGTSEYTKEPETSTLDSIVEGENNSVTAELLTKSGIKLVEGDVIDIRKNLGDNTADFIVTCNALIYVNYPQWEVFKKIYRTLRQNGIALIDSILGLLDQEEDTYDYLNRLGYNFELSDSPQGLHGTAFQKTFPDINIPIGTRREDLNLRQLRLFKITNRRKKT